MATILKSHEPLPTASPEFSGVAGFNLDDFADAGRKQLLAVEAEAARMLNGARSEIERLRKQAIEDGRVEGLEKGMREADQKFKQELAAEVAKRMPILEATLAKWCEIERNYLDEFRDTLMNSILAATERVVLCRLETEPEVLLRWCQSALDAAKSARRLVIAVHPETLVAHGEAIEQLLSQPGLPEDCRIEPDEGIEPAGVVVRTEGGAVSLTLSEQLQRLDEMLRGG